MKRNRILIGTRGSKLARWQADYAAASLQAAHPGLVVEQRILTTKGDRILDVPLAQIGGKGLFTKEIERSLLDGQIDLAVHSLKDMPSAMPDGLVLAAVTQRSAAGDVLVSREQRSFWCLPAGARIGTSSLRRRAQLLHARPELQVESLRGNVDTRLQKLEDGVFDAIVLAEAGLQRLGYADRITERLPFSLCLPAVGQGALALETRADDAEMIELLDCLRDADAMACAAAERSFLSRIEGGCQIPVGVYASLQADGRLRIEAVIASLDGQQLYREHRIGSRETAEFLGQQLAERLLDAGGLDILHALGLLLDRPAYTGR